MSIRHFNTAGPISPTIHYNIPSLHRFDLDEILMLLQQRKYFVLHAPRQVGKTSYMLGLVDYLNQQGTYAAVYANIENAQAARENVYAGIKTILNEISFGAIHHLNDPFLSEQMAKMLENFDEFTALSMSLTEWAKASKRPLVLFIDEIDSLIGDTLISVLRQLRTGYTRRPAAFPHSIVLCGIRDVRDYRIHSSREKTIITGGSAFNIKAKSLRLHDFTKLETFALYRQHTDETDQPFTDEALDLLWYLSGGQPWLVNALGYELCFEMKENRDRSIVITAAMVQVAKERLIRSRATHLDQLADKLKEPRVKQVIEPILAGQDTPENIDNDHISYVQDLGLIRQESRQIQIANPIYQEIIPRELNYSTQMTISHETTWYVEENGLLNIPKLMAAFQQFFRQHSEHWVERFDYKEAGPQLLMQAFLQRIVNGGGRIEREYGLGRKRTDLFILWPIQPQISEMPQEPSVVDAAQTSQMQKIVIELKIRYGELEETIIEGLKQTWNYMDMSDADEGHLVIFDRSKQKRSWEDKIFMYTKQFKGKTIFVWGA